MKALSLTQPWASLMAVGAKRYETRGASFPRSHVGDLAIVSSLSFPRECRTLLRAEPFRSVLAGAGLLGDVGDELRAMLEAARLLERVPAQQERLPLGFVVAVANVVDYCDAEVVAPSAAHPRCYSWTNDNGSQSGDPAHHEHAFGDYSPGRTIILTTGATRLPRPVPVERMRKGVPTAGGALGIYELSPACATAVRLQLGVA